MRWPWQRRPEVDEALKGSAARLADAKATEARMEPKLAHLERLGEKNHIYDAVVRTFRVAR